MQPLIGIGTNHLIRPSDHFDDNYVDYTQKNYVASVTAAGGLPLLLPIGDPQTAAAYIEHVDGLLLTGGQDVTPSLYGAEPEPVNQLNDLARDQFEQALIKAAIAAHKPILGICRGLQIINATLGGTNLQDIASHVNNAIAHNQYPTAWATPTHGITTTPNSRMQAVWGDHGQVNSFHHQAVQQPAPGLTVTATATDGVIEAVEDVTRQLVAVQFHPEMMAATDSHAAAIFSGFVTAATH
ncbi:gamma-glutamyl-gamma-aminobutyrate hydrolase family protein [Furfurilactobacillus entadae]|uniref:gamma-glutamyl-gamma-aminobutyrate hydrolase family protein n=1 Tax=Furfurilactobacillus entadae TaxID=2922307 RepID=UPI0035E82345